jgi:multidrug resistance efflux pump
MIAFLTLIYVAFLFVMIKLKVLPNSSKTWLSTLVWMVVLFLFLFIPMQWGAPAGSVRVLTRAVQIVPNVSGQVVAIPVEANVSLKKGDLLFKIDPEPFEIAVKLAEASLLRVKAQAAQDRDALDNALAQMKQAQAAETLSQARYDDDAKLVQSGVISENRLERRQANLDQAKAAVDQTRAGVSRARTELGAVTEDGVVAKVAEALAGLEQAKWNLEQTEVRAPGEGFVTNLALSVGQRVTNMPFSPSMVFVDTSEKGVVVQINQIYLRYLQTGQPVEMAFKTRPGQLVTGTVDKVFDVASQGQALVSGGVAAGGVVQAEPFLVRITLDDPSAAASLPAGAVGSAAIYTDSVAATHIIRKVMIRMESIMNYVVPVL